MNIAIIPARGGSKRIPRKNIREFAGKPMIAHAIDAAHRSGLFDRIVVSTDDEEISTIAKIHGAEVPFMRPAELADDFVGTTPVVRHALETLGAQGAVIEFACCIYATAPFVIMVSGRKRIWRWALFSDRCWRKKRRAQHDSGRCSATCARRPYYAAWRDRQAQRN